jgi:hypothetical protein
MNGIQINLVKTKIISFTHETNTNYLNCKLYNDLLIRPVVLKISVYFQIASFIFFSVIYLHKLLKRYVWFGILRLLSQLSIVFWFCVVAYTCLV